MFGIILGLLLSPLSYASAELRRFESDGCTMSPDGTPRKPRLWRDCCVEHDLRFWGGGTVSEREYADQRLRSCVEAKAGPKVAELFFRGVQLGSLSPWKIPSKRWGNAWFERAGYRELGHAEVGQLLIELERLELTPQQREDFRQELLARLNP